MKHVALILMLAMAAKAYALPQTLKAQGGSVEMLAIGKPSFMKISGKGSPPTGEVKLDGEKAEGTFEFELATLDTGIGLRDEHIREKYLQVKEHPKAKLKIASVSVKDSEFQGELTLHGVTRPIKGKFTLSEDKKVDATFKIKLSDYKIDIPKYLGITVADDVDVKVKINKLVASAPEAERAR